MSILNNNCLIKANLKINKDLLCRNKDINCASKLSLRDKRIKDEYFIKI
jgi:hypothetical protein